MDLELIRSWTSSAKNTSYSGNFVEACRPILAAGFEHAREEAPDRHAETMAVIADKRAIPRLVVTWDDLYVVVTVDAAGITAEGKEVSFPIFSYRLHRETPPGAH